MENNHDPLKNEKNNTENESTSPRATDDQELEFENPSVDPGFESSTPLSSDREDEPEGDTKDREEDSQNDALNYKNDRENGAYNPKNI